MFIALELCLTVICLAVAYVRPETGEPWFAKLEQRFSAFAQKRSLAVITVGLLALGIRLALLPILPIPVPEIHDEYSHLLLADTLAHGRLANPTHPMWVHFETFHVNWHPTYASMYYPGFAIFLALGKVLLGHPFWGVWLSSGLMCAVICWALQGWMSAEWALVGALLAVIRLGTFSYWVDSYWGGTVAALGGALVVGAFPRIKRDQRVRDAVVMALGMAILASTRPYEGLFLCIPVIIALLWRAYRENLWKRFFLHAAFPTAAIMAVVFVALGYYFWRVTGDPFLVPYKVNIQTYGLVYFPWDKIKPVAEFHHEALRSYYRGAGVVGCYYFALQHPIKLQLLKALVIWLFYFGPVLTLPIAVRPFTRQSRACQSTPTELRFLLFLIACVYLSIMLTIYIGQPHYASPMTVLLYAVVVLLMRDLYRSQPRGQFSPRLIARSVPVICVVLFLARAAAPALQMTPKPSWIRIWCSQDWQNLERARILRQLRGMPGKHLVIVRYQPNHDFILDEWVFNNADINGSKVVWARDMGEVKNRELLQYFSKRHAWLVQPDFKPVAITAYPGSD